MLEVTNCTRVDPVDAMHRGPVHGFCGIWGCLAAGFFEPCPKRENPVFDLDDLGWLTYRFTNISPPKLISFGFRGLGTGLHPLQRLERLRVHPERCGRRLQGRSPQWHHLVGEPGHVPGTPGMGSYGSSSWGPPQSDFTNQRDLWEKKTCIFKEGTKPTARCFFEDFRSRFSVKADSAEVHERCWAWRTGQLPFPLLAGVRKTRTTHNPHVTWQSGAPTIWLIKTDIGFGMSIDMFVLV